MNSHTELIDELIDHRYLTTPRIIDAIRQTPRMPFLKKPHKMLHSLNSPLPIGFGQTISQPLTVAFMLELLQPRSGNKVLEIGYGSGWQTAILCKLVCPPTGTRKGRVYAFEIIPQLAALGKKNLERTISKTQLRQVHLFSHDYRHSFESYGSYDKIIAAAAFEHTPSELISSLTIGGILVYPTHAHDIRKIVRKTEAKYTEELFPGFIFVPITH